MNEIIGRSFIKFLQFWQKTEPIQGMPNFVYNIDMMIPFNPLKHAKGIRKPVSDFRWIDVANAK